MTILRNNCISDIHERKKERERGREREVERLREYVYYNIITSSTVLCPTVHYLLYFAQESTREKKSFSYRIRYWGVYW